MGEFDDALGRILGNPSAMARIAKMAQSLGGGDSPPPVPNPLPPPPGDVRSPDTPPVGPPPAVDAPPLSRREAHPMDAPPPGTSHAADSPPPRPFQAANSPLPGLPPEPPPAPGLSDLAELADSPLVRRLLPLLLEGRRNSEARRFLYALRPYLSPRRQENVERALQMARLIRVGRRFLSEGQGGSLTGEPPQRGRKHGGTEGV